jgi:hypothetical protein
VGLSKYWLRCTVDVSDKKELILDRVETDEQLSFAAKTTILAPRHGDWSGYAESFQ